MFFYKEISIIKFLSAFYRSSCCMIEAFFDNEGMEGIYLLVSGGAERNKGGEGRVNGALGRCW